MRKIIVVATSFLVLWGCKPKAGDSETSAIVGSENGEERAFGIVALRNDVQMQKELSFLKDSSMREAWKDMNEVFYAMIECAPSTSDGHRISAAQWMNWVEYISFAGILYATPDRRIEYTLTNGGKTKNFSPNCRIRPTRLMNLPMLMGVSKGIQGFPAKEPKQGTKEYTSLRADFELMQTVFLALRGPFSPGGLGISPKAFGFQEGAANYPTIDFSATDLAIAMHGADPTFNPCIKPKKTGGALDYLQDWKLIAYSCVPSAAKGLYNYKAGGRDGSRYVELRNNAERRLAAIYEGTYGTLQAGASSERQLLEVLTHPLPWKTLTGPAASLASYLAGQGSSGSALTSFDHASFFANHKKHAAAGFALAGDQPSPLQISRGRLQAQQLAEMISQGDINTAADMVPYFKSDWSSAAEGIVKNSKGNVILWQPRRDQETNAAFDKLQQTAQATLAQREAAFAKWGEADPNRASGTEYAKWYSAQHGATMDQFQKELIAYNNGLIKGSNNNSLYTNKKTDLGVTSYRNYQNDYLVAGGGSDNGAVQDLRVQQPAAGSEIKYQWDQANVDTKPNDFIDMNRSVGWNTDGTGFQTVQTASTNGAPGLNFDYGFQANPKSETGSVGRFTMDTSQMASATEQLNTMVSSSQQNVAAAQQSSGTGIWDGLSQWGSGWSAAAQAQDGVNQIAEQSRFSGDGTAITQTMNTASGELSGLRDQGFSAGNAGFQQAWTGTKEYATSGEMWNDASTAMSNGASYVSNTFGFGSSTPSTEAPASEPVQSTPPVMPDPIQETNPPVYAGESYADAGMLALTGEEVKDEPAKEPETDAPD